jgi:rare lipoprotein A
LLAACGGMFDSSTGVHRGAFTSREYGVAVSPRVSNSKHPPRGGGRYLVGQPYKVHGDWYTPAEQPNYAATGSASWYGNDFHGRLTANGEIFDANSITGGHPTLPLPSYVRVTNLDNGRALTVRINDRGPYMSGRIVDLSQRAADLLGYSTQGTARVQVQYVSPAPLNGDDNRMLMASLDTSHEFMPQGGTRFAMNQPAKRRGNNPGGLIGGVMSLFSYADAQKEDVAINSAHAAVDAMATRAPQLQDWVATTDMDARKIKLELGIFTDPAQQQKVEETFAMIGAVDEESVMKGSDPGTRLTLTHLKPGVGRSDVLDRVRELGLEDVILY